MPVFHTDIVETNTSTPSALQRLPGALTKLWSRREALEDFEGFEREVHALFAETEREVLAEGLERLDVDLPLVVIEGQVHHRVLRSPETYTTAVGSVTATRTLYRTDKDAQAVVPLELRAGIVAGHWTALAARQATFLVAHLTPRMCCESSAT